MKVQEFFDKSTSTLTYIVYDEKTRDAIVIDPVLDFDMASSRVGLQSAERLLQFVSKNALNVHFIFETHAHADHLSSASELKKHWPMSKIAIGEGIQKVQRHFKNVFGWPDMKTDGSQFDFLLHDQETVVAGSLKLKILAVPGHTPACMAFLIKDAIFSGDCIFMPDSGTGRCDFPDGSATELYNSITQKIYTLPDATRIFVGHDYQPGGRNLQFVSTVLEQKTRNIHLNKGIRLEEFKAFREERDKTLAAPKLLYPSIQFNMRAGKSFENAK